jgi:hypothetical protein
MKKFLVFSIMAFIGLAMSQTSTAQYAEPEKVVIEKSKLPTELLKEIESDARLAEMEKKIETYGKWVGVGNEIGTAVKEGLTAVVDVADKFGKTDVGKFTLAMVAWKVMGKDILRIAFGLIFLVIFTIFIFRYHKQNFTVHKVATNDNGWKFWLPKQYQMVEPKEYEAYEFVKWLNIIMLLGGFAITYAIMFG